MATGTMESLWSKANQTQLATIETGATASRAYDEGEFFCKDGLLYRATTAISSGGTITPGTNCEQASRGGLNELRVANASWYPVTSNTNYTVNSLEIRLIGRRVAIALFDVTVATATTSVVTVGYTQATPANSVENVFYAIDRTGGEPLWIGVGTNRTIQMRGGVTGKTYRGSFTMFL